MADSHNVLKRVEKLEVSPELDGYSKVIIYTGEVDEDGNDIIYMAGQDGGEVLEVKNPFGTQEMANNILSQIRGWQYQPYDARGAHLDPVAEMGDGVTLNDTYSGIFARATNFNKMMTCNLGAPADTEVAHEFSVESPSDRVYSRFVKSTKSSFRITANQIRAEVEARTEQGEILQSEIDVNAQEIVARVKKTDANSDNTFGWKLTSDSWEIFSGDTNSTVLRATKEGLEVKGVIKADTGYIGGENGFVITASAIYNNIPNYSKTVASQTSGVYIGKDGIRLGDKFFVDNDGDLTASSGTFGSLSVRTDGNTKGTYYGGLSKCTGTVSDLDGSLSTDINVGTKGISTYVGDIAASKITASYISAKLGAIKTFQLNGHTVSEHWITDGDGSSVQVLATQW